MEYCPHGNLRKFLRNSRSRYRVEEKGLITDLSQVFGPKNLIHFGLQIAKGMKFLISRKVVFSPSHCVQNFTLYPQFSSTFPYFLICYLSGDSPRSGSTKYFDWTRVCRESRRLWFGQRCLQIPRIRANVNGKFITLNIPGSSIKFNCALHHEVLLTLIQVT